MGLATLVVLSLGLIQTSILLLPIIYISLSFFIVTLARILDHKD